jgi:hypothetical protein
VRKGGLDLSKAHAGATAQIEFSRRQTKAEWSQEVACEPLGRAGVSG